MNLNYAKAIRLMIQLAKTKITAMMHITSPPILKQLLFSLAPAPRVNDPAMMIKIPDQIPPELMLPHQLVAATSIIIPRKNVMKPLIRTAIPNRKNQKKKINNINVIVRKNIYPEYILLSFLSLTLSLPGSSDFL